MFRNSKRRYKPEIEWSNNSWTHNIFRVYEIIFWRKIGIRPESSVRLEKDYKDNEYENYELYTFEAYCAYFETWLRNLFNRRWSVIKLHGFQLATNPYSSIGLKLPMANFAIALDVATSSTAGTASPKTWSHTVTGSSPLIAICVGAISGASPPASTAASYSAAAATKAQSNQKTGSSFNEESSIWFKGSAATGANTVSVSWTFTINQGIAGVSISYSGAQSGDAADAVNGLTGTATGAQSFNVTTVADNCWVVAIGVMAANISSTLTATQTTRGSVAPVANCLMRAEDTNAAKTPAGVQAMGFTVGGTAVDSWAMSGASFAPAASPGAVVSVSTALMMGV